MGERLIDEMPLHSALCSNSLCKGCWQFYRNSEDEALDREIAEMLVGVLTHGFSSGTFRTELILSALRANYDVTIKRKSNQSETQEI